ncbi:ATP-binding protein [Roseicella aerolata]|uniref:AAA family ATPase n=1 Tax=Roseicella aerolata TaxID=2883479 RepID=A0A9X1IC12_9PROT|nr:AAA family ATPase [Roseicella aerolata]MCB4820968.1 AAA family ATPase [Roseicella aerolata]
MAAGAAPGTTCPACGTPVGPTARFCSECGHRLGGDSAGAAPLRELRPMTVLFCGIPEPAAGATDAEAHGEMLAAVLHVATHVAERHGGRLVRFLGDGVLVHFGWPAAQEDDTLRAAEAAFAIRDAVAAEVPAGAGPVRIRAGIAAGLVMVADAAGTGDPRHLSVLGEALNLAARLQALAAPGTVLVSDSVRRQLAGRFALRPCGPQAIKGWAEPVPVWQLLGPAGARERDAAAAARIPLIGRAAPLDELRRLWQAAAAGQGATVLVHGEAGIGKSRLLAQLLTEVPREHQLRLFAAPQEQRMPLQPVVRWIGRAAALLPEDPLAQRRRKLERLLAGAAPAGLAAVAMLMGAAEDSAAETPQRRRRRLLQSLVSIVAEAARRRPVLLAFEDLHWADPTTLEALDMLAGRVAGLPVLLLATARPGPLPAWAEAPATLRIHLDPLDGEAAEALMRAVAQDVPLPAGLAHDILQRAEGVPLFLEEMTRAVIEALTHAAPAGGERLGSLPVPASLQASLLARLERVGGARRVAEVAAIIGREFEPALLASILGGDLPALGLQLDRLAAADLLQRQGADRFRFRHVLLQRAAVGLMPRDRYRSLHAQVAAALEGGPGLATPQRIAQHWTEAGHRREALAWWLRGADQALARSAPAEALAQLRRVRECLDEEPEGEARLQAELDLELRMGDALLVLHGHGAAETGLAYDRARALSERLPGHPALLTAMHGQWSHAWMRGLIPLSLERAEALLRVAEEAGSPSGLTIAHSALAHSQLFLGRFRAAAGSAARSLAQHDPADRTRRHDLALQTTVISTRCYGAWARMFLGRTAGLREELALTLQAAERAGVPFAIANAGYALGLFDAEHGAEATALARFRATARLCAEQEIGFLTLTAGAMAALLAGRLGDPAAGLAEIRGVVAGSQETSLFGLLPHFLGIEAELLARAGDPAAGLARLAEAEARLRETGALWEEAPLLCRRGELLAALGEAAGAEAAWRAALAVAERQEAALYTLRAALALAGQLARTGRVAEARRMLAAALGPFGMVQEPVVQRARALLDSLRQGPAPARHAGSMPDPSPV